MHYSDQTQRYLSGETFSNGALITVDKEASPLVNRDDFLLQVTKGKKVLHLGFVDHLPLIDEKIRQGKWLHKKLIDNTTLCYGIDINQEGIEYIQKEHHIDNLYTLDVILDTLPQALLDVKFDYLLIPDVIEHIGNPVAFLEVIREKFKQNTSKIILTTPNAFRWNNFLNVFKHRELINSDHRFWFTPYTLSKIVTDAGYKIDDLGYFEHGRLSRRQVIRRYLLNNYPLLRDTLIMEIEL